MLYMMTRCLSILYDSFNTQCLLCFIYSSLTSDQLIYPFLVFDYSFKADGSRGENPDNSQRGITHCFLSCVMTELLPVSDHCLRAVFKIVSVTQDTKS